MGNKTLKQAASNPIFLSILSGILLALCFPKFNLYFLAWIALVPFLFAVQITGAPFAAGFAFGLAFFSINLFWLNSLSAFVGFWAVLGYVLLVIFQALFFGAAGIFINFAREKSPAICHLTVPAVWCAFEWFRTIPPFSDSFSGFWSTFGVAAGGLGYTQSYFLPVLQLSSFFSVYGISFFIVYVNSILSSIPRYYSLAKDSDFKAKKSRRCLFYALASFIIVCFWGIGELGYPPAKAQNSTRFAVIQGNIDQKTKMNPASLYSSFSTYRSLTFQAKKFRPDIVIWSETAITTYLMENSYLLNKTEEMADELDAALIIGAPTRGRRGEIYNSLVFFNQWGEVLGFYHKEHLVPFGEYLPFREILFPLLKKTEYFENDFSPGQNPRLIQINGIPLGALICFESTLPYLSAARTEKKAGLLLTVTNDAWFGDSSALEQHLQMGILRAVENRRYFIQAANTGISALIDPYGRILARSRPNRAEVLVFKVPLP